MRLTPLAILLCAVPSLVLAQAPANPPPDAPPEAAPPPPDGPPPEAPPPPPQAMPAPPSAPTPAPVAAPAGKWVFTRQYGWLWIPYDRQFVYVPPDPQIFPEQFVYYPVYGWRWVVAPWVYGYGPQPWWGPGGVVVFSWYARPWFRVGGYWGWGGYHGWGYYRGWMGPRMWGARGWARAPVYYRTGVGDRHAVPAYRPAPARREEHERSRREHR
jgi:hypothetical protein